MKTNKIKNKQTKDECIEHLLKLIENKNAIISHYDKKYDSENNDFKTKTPDKTSA